MAEQRDTDYNSGSTFHGLGLPRNVVESLAAEGITTPTAIQREVIPHAIDGKDIIGVAQTGTGKTLAYGIPTVERLSRLGGRALVLVPTRELTEQIRTELAVVGRVYRIQMVAIFGGIDLLTQRALLNRRNVRLVVATPGQLIQHLERGIPLGVPQAPARDDAHQAQETLSLADLRTLVIDEADRMMDERFKPQLHQVLKHVPKSRQTMVFSATMPQEVVELVTAEMHEPMRIEVTASGTVVEKIDQELIVVHPQLKFDVLERLLADNPGQSLVFCNTRVGTEKIAHLLWRDGFNAAAMHKHCDKFERRQILQDFKSGKLRILVATDIAGRGIDSAQITLVVNFDVPEKIEDYVHRIGRTGRAGGAGRAVTLATPEQSMELIPKIEKFIGKPIPRGQLPDTKK